MGNFKVLDKTDKLIVYVNQYVCLSIPKVYSVYRDELYKTLFSLRKNILTANTNYNNNYRLKYQRDALVDIASIDFFLNFFKKNEVIGNKRFMSSIGLLNDINIMIKAWINSEKKES